VVLEHVLVEHATHGVGVHRRGVLNDKVDPYLRPLYDALGDMLGADQLKRYMDDGSIEVAPLAYMRCSRASGRVPKYPNRRRPWGR